MPASCRDHWESAELAELLEGVVNDRYSRVVVLAGAGISTHSGIADFRSPRTGLYDNLSQYNLPYPEALFELPFLRKRPRNFFTYLKNLYMQLSDDRFRPNLIHYFLCLLHKKKKLLRVYTQNIDGLEKLAGLPSNLVVQAHGSPNTASCIGCGKGFNKTFVQVCLGRIFTESIGFMKQLFLRSNSIPSCNSCRNIVKPDIVFFGEDLPSEFWRHRQDLNQADLVLIMGTSLQVEPFSNVVRAINPNSVVVLLNNQHIHPFRQLKHRKLALLGDLLESVQKLASQLNWHQELIELSEQPLQSRDSFSVQERVSSLPFSRSTSCVALRPPSTASDSSIATLSTQTNLFRTPQRRLKTTSSSHTKPSRANPPPPTKAAAKKKKKPQKNKKARRVSFVPACPVRASSSLEENEVAPKLSSSELNSDNKLLLHRTQLQPQLLYGVTEAIKRISLHADTFRNDAFLSAGLGGVVLKKTLDKLDAIPLPAIS